MSIVATIGVNAALSDSATGLNVVGIGSVVLNISSSLGVEDVLLPPNTLNQPLPLPVGLTAAQFVFVGAVSIPDLQIVDGSMTAGTSTSASSAGTSVFVNDTIILNVDGDGVKTILLAANTTGVAIAADIQAKVRALAATSPVKQLAYNGFTTVFTGGQYVLTSGIFGSGSTVVVSGGTTAVNLKLGVSNGGTEAAGAGSASQQLPMGAATVLYNLASPVMVSTAAGGLLQFSIGG